MCFVWNVLLWHVHVRTGIRQTDKQTQSVKGGQEDFRTFFLHAWMQPNAIRGDCGSGGKVGRPLIRRSVVGTLAPPLCMLCVLGQDTDPDVRMGEQRHIVGCFG